MFSTVMGKPRLPDLAALRRREVDLPCNPVLAAANTRTDFTIYAHLQDLSIESLHLDLSPRHLVLSGWAVQCSADALPCAGPFRSSHSLPPSVSLNNFSLTFNEGLFTLRLLKKGHLKHAL
uniref:Hsp20/alpha crystallin family protein n=1 Tax=Pseudomonas laurentiana TaxID=2364649 RepID=UPI0029C98F59|nr:Hsp20/alpha crystallin family protein [Pseudomonas laurentiana]